MSFVLLYWKECLIAILAGSCFFAVRSCESAHDKVVQIQTEDRALAEQAKHEADEKQANDKREYDDAKHDFQTQIDQLAADHRVASMQCVRHSTGSSPVPAAPIAAPGAVAEERADVPPAPTFDPGPAIDQLTRECDRLAIEHSALVDWVIGTR